MKSPFGGALSVAVRADSPSKPLRNFLAYFIALISIEIQHGRVRFDTILHDFCAV
ncbi:MAG: hypothetical protein KIT00_04110 [Rhodospirillales bacterium]|nr:hypothetical protein [Rhodospirillales bacterium]